MNQALRRRYLPMTESAFYILLSLGTERHGYGVMQHVESLTDGRLKLGAGTLYGTLSKMESDGLISPIREIDRRKTYLRTESGHELLGIERVRLKEMVDNGERESEDPR